MKIYQDYLDEERAQQLTIEQLIELLNKYPKDARVYHEGCDCYGTANGVEYDPKDNTILITRIQG